MITIHSLELIKDSKEPITYAYNGYIFTITKLKEKHKGVPLYIIDFKNKRYNEILVGEIGWHIKKTNTIRVQSYNMYGTMNYIFRVIHKWEEYEY